MMNMPPPVFLDNWIHLFRAPWVQDRCKLRFPGAPDPPSVVLDAFGYYLPCTLQKTGENSKMKRMEGEMLFIIPEERDSLLGAQEFELGPRKGFLAVQLKKESWRFEDIKIRNHAWKYLERKLFTTFVISSVGWREHHTSELLEMPASWSQPFIGKTVNVGYNLTFSTRGPQSRVVEVSYW